MLTLIIGVICLLAGSYVGNKWGRAAILKEQAFLAAAKQTVNVIRQTGQNVKRVL